MHDEVQEGSDEKRIVTPRILYAGERLSVLPDSRMPYRLWKNMTVAADLREDAFDMLLDDFRKYVDSQLHSSGRVRLEKEDCHYLMHVRRFEQPSSIEVYITGEGNVDIARASFVLNAHGVTITDNQGFRRFRREHPKLSLMTVWADPESKAYQTLDDYCDHIKQRMPTGE